MQPESGSLHYQEVVLPPLCLSYMLTASIFMEERRSNAFAFMLSLPVEPFELNLAKYLSLYSMILPTLGLPAAAWALMGKDWTEPFCALAGGLLLSTIVAAGTTWTISRILFVAPLVPPAALAFFILVEQPPPHGFAMTLYHWARSNPIIVAEAAICLCPLIAVYASWILQQRESRGYLDAF